MHLVALTSSSHRARDQIFTPLRRYAAFGPGGEIGVVCLTSSPFVSPATDDLRLVPGSACIDAALTQGAGGCSLPRAICDDDRSPEDPSWG